MSEQYDVIIAGAGPVGLCLAYELQLAGVSVVVLERDAHNSSPWRTAPLGRRGLTTPSLEMLYRRDLIQEFRGTDKLPYWEKPAGFKFAGHFAGITFDGSKIDFSQWKYHLPAPFEISISSLAQVEGFYANHAEKLGATILRGKEITRLEDSGDSVTVWADDKPIVAKYLVGCDGGRSTVRKLAEFDFIGTEAEFTGYITRTEVDRPELLKPMFQYGKRGMYIFLPPDNITAMDFDLSFDRTQAVTKEHFQNVLQRVTGTDIGVKQLHNAASFTDRAKQVSQYQRGRVFLAGDSAHIHSPLGAQGLNTGLGDAFNLGWKLAAAIKGTASPQLLATYHQERFPAGADILEWTRAQTAILRPESAALYRLTREALESGSSAYYVDRMWGLSQRYDLGSENPLVGRSVPDFVLDASSRLGPKLKTGCFLVVDFTKSDAVKDSVASMGTSVQYCASEAEETFGAKALLVRPDGVVAWVATEQVDVDELKSALAKWVSLP